MIKNTFVSLNGARNKLIGKKFELIDIEESGKVLYLQDNEGRIYAIDSTGEGGARVCIQKTDSEELEELQMKFNTLVKMLNVDYDELEDNVLKQYFE
ncbi:hypothetical protein J2Z76_001715 [Sedimentibacter acidaminivorans]|uniref:Uncharacterized protein n=1 Tax=Sedimentibacter acidaminivorans TaxID=913099 RepID=A0ABS4GDY0_9FIRM|nr:hypothetical protein [Sedimentibacter acidaminivorans]MBP1925854.1 hypothetical protein [Sedimentibacter acidaminivorans]